MTKGEYNFSGATTFTGEIKLKSGETVPCVARCETLKGVLISTDGWRSQWRVGTETPFDPDDEQRVARSCP